MDILTAMRWAESEWELFSGNSIRSYWKHCFNNLSYARNPALDMNALLRSFVTEAAHYNYIKYTRLEIETLLNPEGKNK